VIRSSNGRQGSDEPRLRRLVPLVLALAILTGACAPGVVPSPTSAPAPATAAPAHAPEIRFGLIGEVSDENVWGLFEGRGNPYNDYAIRSQYWPRLFRASIPDQLIAPALAAEAPSPVTQEGIFYTASVRVRRDLIWTDDSPFTAEDVAFTVNTVLKFELGFDWRDYYNPEWLDHAEAVAPDTVKFFFRRAPGVDTWQYGALRGPVVHEGFWSAKVVAAAESLPSDELYAGIQALRPKIATLQEEVNALYAATLGAQGEQARELQAALRRQQGNLDEATNDLAEEQESLQAAMNEARARLYEQDDDGEPLLGAWLPQGGNFEEDEALGFVNVPYPGFPGPVPNFDRALYQTYHSRETAAMALADGRVNVILDPVPQVAETALSTMTSRTRSLRFLVFGVNSSSLGDSTLRRAVACVVDQPGMSVGLEGRAAPLTSFVDQDETWWHTADALLPCAGLDSAARFSQAVEILKAGGYTWEQEPAEGAAGRGLRRPDGSLVPTVRLLAPADDETRVLAATYAEQKIVGLGVPMGVETVTEDLINFAVLSSGDFEMAVMGWKVSAFPGYLCDWFGPEAPFSYDTTPMTSLCGELAATSDLEKAREQLHAMQRVLADEVPMLPLYSTPIREDMHGVTYPFASVLDGLAGVYGAPEFAIPAVP